MALRVRRHTGVITSRRGWVTPALAGSVALLLPLASFLVATWLLGWQLQSVLSGSMSPTLGKSLGMALIESGVAAVGNEIGILIRGATVPAKIIKLPFYKRK